MNMTHKEALLVARSHLWGEANDVCEDVTLTDFLRAYIEARGLVLVPKEPTARMVEDAREAHEGEHYLPYSLYTAMLAAAPDPFKDEVQ